MINPPTRIILVRHGQSTFNAQGRFQGRSDQAVLTETGRLASYQTGISLSELEIDAVYTSPLQRTQETAQEILAAMAAITDAVTDKVQTYQTHAHLQEIDLPTWQGLPFQQVREQQQQAYRVWKEQPHRFPMQTEVMEQRSALAVASPPEESFPVLNLYRQAEAFWQEILPRHIGQTILVVSHGGTIRALLHTALTRGANPQLAAPYFHRIQQSNCGVSILTFSQPGQPATLEALNLTHHLGETLPKLKEGKLGMRLLLLPVGTTAIPNMQQIGGLQEQILQVPLNFCLTAPGTAAKEMAQAILPQHPQNPVQIYVSQEQFFSPWHQTILKRCPQAPTLCTGLVINSVNAIQTILQEILAPELIAPSALALQPNQLSVLHYPAILNQPVIQAINLGSATQSSIS